MKNIFTKIPKWVYITAIVITTFVIIFQIRKKDEAKFMIIEPVGIGEVKNDITAQGVIKAAQKIDLNVYKQALRLNQVSITNGAEIAEDQVLFAYEAGDVQTDVNTANIDVKEARLQLEEVRIQSRQKNFDIAESKTSLLSLETIIARQDQERQQAKREFYSTELEVIPAQDRRSAQAGSVKPEVSGIYRGEEGVYNIEIYRSSSETGLSFRLKGVENGAYTLFPAIQRPLGTLGLDITFPTLEQIRSQDEWVIEIPNTKADSYLSTKKTYEDTLIRLDQELEENQIALSKTGQTLREQKRNDTNAYRQLAVSQAEVRLEQAQERLRSARRIASERVIKAPFAGIVNGTRNVVSGTTLRADDDTVQFGTLVSNDFVTTFNLRIEDITKVNIEDTISALIPSLPTVTGLEAIVNEISVLPNSEGSYEVRATLIIDDTVRGLLREGLSVDISIPQEQVLETVRVAKASVQYEDGSPYVQVVSNISNEQKEELNIFGSIDVTDMEIVSEKRFVEIGLIGKQYIEIVDNLEQGEYILTTMSSNSMSSDTEYMMGGDSSWDDFDSEGDNIYVDL